ncbi:predicted protein [Histoplasma capsulatum G186AR]|uniref:Uncharacterized protein n=1 Tax=Ajellomyces capsulatus (strain G186AR / H82 / ATCC MYA-2454 / RMSCC 2432) TaxID=447093 RepID=C0NCQ6_AJECG|nr:uncharacterized protein HCBG_00902 [Histoplasma capsulatum G186AR]EEH11447.1 predicted protein [Histoplasma capsulatum G186AR]
MAISTRSLEHRSFLPPFHGFTVPGHKYWQPPPQSWCLLGQKSARSRVQRTVDNAVSPIPALCLWLASMQLNKGAKSMLSAEEYSSRWLDSHNIICLSPPGSLLLRSSLWLGPFLSTTARIAVPESFECHDGWMPLVEVSDEQSDTVLVTGEK